VKLSKIGFVNAGQSDCDRKDRKMLKRMPLCDLVSVKRSNKHQELDT